MQFLENPPKGRVKFLFFGYLCSRGKAQVFGSSKLEVRVLEIVKSTCPECLNQSHRLINCLGHDSSPIETNWLRFLIGPGIGRLRPLNFDNSSSSWVDKVTLGAVRKIERMTVIVVFTPSHQRNIPTSKLKKNMGLPSLSEIHASSRLQTLP